MINENILNGLKLALAKGETLQKAMMTFYNAGYVKAEIEEAAAELQALQSQGQVFENSTNMYYSPSKSQQTVSNYGEKINTSKKKTMIIILIVLFLILLLLAGIIFFKDQVLSIFSGLF